MSERPIIFGADSVRAILAGQKTQTRRPVKPQPPETHDALCAVMPEACVKSPRSVAIWLPKEPDEDTIGWTVACPYGVPGDRLGCRTTWWRYSAPSTNPGNEQAWDETTRVARWRSGEAVLDVEPDTAADLRWKRRSPIHMPRLASRLTLEVTEIRVQRVQEISEEDAKAEGVPIRRYTDGRGVEDRRTGFRFAWDRINGKRAPWESNPWVWAVSFKVVNP